MWNSAENRIVPFAGDFFAPKRGNRSIFSAICTSMAGLEFHGRIQGNPARACEQARRAISMAPCSGKLRQFCYVVPHERRRETRRCLALLESEDNKFETPVNSLKDLPPIFDCKVARDIRLQVEQYLPQLLRAKIAV